MDACATFGNQRVLFSKKQINNIYIDFSVDTLFYFQFF